MSFPKGAAQSIRRSRSKRALTECEIQRKLERFRLYQIQSTLDGGKWTEAEADVTALQTLLRAGIRPTRRMMSWLVVGDLPISICEWSADLDEKDVSYRDEYSQNFYPDKQYALFPVGTLARFNSLQPRMWFGWAFRSRYVHPQPFMHCTGENRNPYFPHGSLIRTGVKP
jgi:hypothetical protein